MGRKRPRRRAWPLRAPIGVAVLAAALVVGAVIPGLAQPGEGSDALMASLLQVEDLPAGFDTLGPEEGSQFDIDSGAFSRFGGRRVVSQVWSSESSGVVFDFRIELPSPEAAASYLDEAEATLSEADATGLALATDPPPVGEDTRHYAGVTRIDAERAITFDNFLFRVGPVAAKVFVGSVDLPEGEAQRLAEAAAERMTGFASPEIGPGAFEAASPAPSNPAGSPSPAGSSSPAPSPAAVGRLAALVPAAIVETCRPFDPGTLGEAAALTCMLRGDLVVYSAFADHAALDEAFETATADMPKDDLADSCAEAPSSGPYPTDGAPRGRVACWEPPGGGLVLFWTHDADLVLGGILAESDDHADLDAAWQAARTH